jgi:general secretion pathway protein D
VRFDQPATALKTGAPLTLNLQIDNAADLFGAPMRLKWDPKVLRLNDVSRGALLASDGQQPIFTRNIRNDEGEAVVVLNRAAGAPGVNGSGTLLTLTFQAIGKGSTAVSVLDLSLRNAQMQPVSAQPAPAMVNVE